MNNTVLGNYPVPNPIPLSYQTKDQQQPRLIIVGEGVLQRLHSFGLTIDDVADPDKMFSIFTPREFNTFYNVCDFTIPGYSQLADLLGMDFLPFNKYSLIGEKELKPTEESKKYIDMLQYTPFELSPVEALTFQLGYSIDKVPERLQIDLKCIGDNFFACIISEAEPTSSERHLYNVCDTACNKLYDIYGSRWVAKTRVFSEMVRLSQLSALNRNS
jgi:hypothetical protein